MVEIQLLRLLVKKGSNMIAEIFFQTMKMLLFCNSTFFVNTVVVNSEYSKSKSDNNKTAIATTS